MFLVIRIKTKKKESIIEKKNHLINHNLTLVHLLYNRILLLINNNIIIKFVNKY